MKTELNTLAATAHTPADWRIGDAGHAVFGPKRDQPSPEIVATDLTRANAAHIVLCVNSHERLKAALEHVLGIYGDKWTENTRACVRAALAASHPKP